MQESRFKMVSLHIMKFTREVTFRFIGRSSYLILGVEAEWKADGVGGYSVSDHRGRRQSCSKGRVGQSQTVDWVVCLYVHNHLKPSSSNSDWYGLWLQEFLQLKKLCGQFDDWDSFVCIYTCSCTFVAVRFCTFVVFRKYATCGFPVVQLATAKKRNGTKKCNFRFIYLKHEKIYSSKQDVSN